MFPTLYSRTSTAALLMLLGSSAASATSVVWSPPSLRAGPGWARTASSASDQAPETILYGFKNFPDGSSPSGQLIADKDGSLYGTTQEGGLVFPTGNVEDGGGGGTVFKLTSKGTGYTESVIYRFGASGIQDGYFPWIGSALAMDGTGALYGTTSLGGRVFGYGTVYKLTPTASGYKETILHTFQGPDGAGPASNPILDQSGALYGTTYSGPSLGSAYDAGVVYKLTPSKSGYAFSILHRFGSAGSNDGSEPYGALLLDAKTGNLYGTTEYGGTTHNLANGGYGTVFRLSPTASGYRYTIINNFHGSDGAWPLASLIMDSAGALYGTASSGGLSSFGVVYKLTPASTGYVETVLYKFTGGLDGSAPASPLVADRSGTLYSTTSVGGQYGGVFFGGTVFELVRTQSGYREVTLHAFNPKTDGYEEGPGNTCGVLLEGNYLLGETWGASETTLGNIFSLEIQ
jgi:uncharacterized repeat protein (TIGR03803 family)